MCKNLKFIKRLICFRDYVSPNQNHVLGIAKYYNWDSIASESFEFKKEIFEITELIEFNDLTHLFPMQPFSTPWKHQQTLQFSDVFRR